MSKLLNLIALGLLIYLGSHYWPVEEPAWKEFTETQWRERLTEAQYEVLREKGTEDAYSGALLKEERTGLYSCAGCANPLFQSSSKFDSGTGWPSFDKPTTTKSVTHHRHNTVLAVAVEVRCSRCGGHLGHVFPDGPTNTGMRYCMNSLALSFKPESGEKP